MNDYDLNGRLTAANAGWNHSPAPPQRMSSTGSETSLRSIVEGLARVSGAAFFRCAAEVAGQVLGATHAAVGDLSPDGGRVRVSGMWTRQGVPLPSEYAVAGTPTEEVIRGAAAMHYPLGLRSSFPEDPRLSRLYAESYVGVPVVDAGGDVLGIIELIFDRPLEDATAATTALLALAGRATAEIERDQAEAALRDSETRYRALIEDSFNLVAEVVDERYVYASAGYTEALGYAPEELLGGRVFDQLHPDDRRPVAGHLQAALGATAATHFTARMRHRNGEWRWIETSARAFRASGGEYRTTLFSRDVTERRREEEQLRQSAETFRSLVKDLRIGVVLFDADARVLVCNDAAIELLGRPEQDVIDKTSFNFNWTPLRHDGSVMPVEERPVPLAISTRKPVRDVVMGVDRLDRGDRVWALVSAEPQLDENGAVQRVIVSMSDITARLAAERELRESEARFRLLAENSTDVIARYAPDTTCLWISPSVQTVTGYIPEEILGRSLPYLFGGSNVDVLQRAREKTEAGEESFFTTFPLQHKDGHLIWLEATNRVLRDASGEIREIQSAARDITERKRADDELRESEARFRLLAENATDIIARVAPDGVCLWVSPSVTAIAGYEPSELIGRNLRDGVHPEDAIALTQDPGWERPDCVTSVLRYRHKDGHYVWLETTSKAIRDPETGAVIEIHNTSRDVTARRAAEEALRESEELLRMTLESTADGIIVTKPGAEILYCNSRAATILQIPEHILQSRNARELIEHLVEHAEAPDDLAAMLRSVSSEGATDAGTWTSKRGKVIEASVHTVPAASGLALRVWTVRDVTEKRQAEEALRQSEERLRTVISGAPLVLVAIDPQGTIVLAEGQGLAIIGVDGDAITGRPIDEVFAARPEIVADVRRALGGEEFSAIHAIQSATFEAHFRPVRNGHGAVTGVLAVAFDVTARVHAEAALRESEETARALLNAPTDAAVLVDRDGTILALNRTAESRFRDHASSLGVEASQLVGTCVFDLFPRDLRAQRKARNDEVFENGERRHFEDERDGIWTDVTIDPIHDADGNVVRLAIFSRDITDRKRDEAALRKRSRELEALNDYLEKQSAELERSREELREASEQLADLLEAEQVRSKTDPLTGALNHGAISDVVTEAIDAEVALAVAMVDVDGMKAINDTYGHQAGDQVLLEVAKAITRGGAITGRYGGDEFLVALLNATREEAEDYKAAVDAALRDAVVTDTDSGARVAVVASVGVAIYPDDAATLTALIERADERMYEEKKERRATGLSSSREFGDERVAPMVGELVPLLTGDGTLDEKLRLVAHRVAVGGGYAGVNFDVFAGEAEPDGSPGATINQNAFSKAPDEILDAWNRHQRQNTQRTVSEIVRQTRQPLVIDEIATSEYVTEQQKELLGKIGIRSGLVVPLFDGDDLFALMSVGASETAAFTARDVRFLGAVAQQVAAVVRLAQLADRLRAEPDRDPGVPSEPGAEAA